MSDFVVCSECRWHGGKVEMLTARHPFDDEDLVYGCPRCKSVDSLSVACDEPGCKSEVSCGTPTPDGYRQTCSEHRPK
jgi:hypothetical protein